VNILLWILGCLVGYLLIGGLIAWLFVRYEEDTEANDASLFLFLWPVMLCMYGPVLWFMKWMVRTESKKEYEAILEREEKDRLAKEERDRHR
jgi:cytochrome c-type biogenesis protein CcmH/NrfF